MIISLYSRHVFTLIQTEATMPYVEFKPVRGQRYSQTGLQTRSNVPITKLRRLKDKSIFPNLPNPTSERWVVIFVYSGLRTWETMIVDATFCTVQRQGWARAFFLSSKRFHALRRVSFHQRKALQGDNPNHFFALLCPVLSEFSASFQSTRTRQLKEHGMHNEVWSSTPKTLHHEYHDYRNQQSVSRTIPPLIEILCSVTWRSFQQLLGYISNFHTCPFDFKIIEEQLWEYRCTNTRDLVEDHWAVSQGFLKIVANSEDIVKEVLPAIERSHDIYSEVVRGRMANGGQGDAFLKAYSCARRDQSSEIDMEEWLTGGKFRTFYDNPEMRKWLVSS